MADTVELMHLVRDMIGSAHNVEQAAENLLTARATPTAVVAACIIVVREQPAAMVDLENSLDASEAQNSILMDDINDLEAHGDRRSRRAK